MKSKISPDKEKAKSLVNMAKITYQRLKETEILKYPSNSLTDYYDIIHKLMEAISIKNGIKFKGDGAHYELIEHIIKENGFSEETRIFLQELRDYRNRISYEGFNVKKNYIKINKKRFDIFISSLMEILEDN